MLVTKYFVRCSDFNIVSLVTYALPSWGGFVSAELISMIDGMLRRLKRFGYLKDSIKF